MPLPLVPLIAAGSSLLSTVLNNNAVNSANQQSRDFQVQMYDRQRADAIADRDFQNFYNSPAEQMKRLTAAGLNPNLVYGSGTSMASVVTRGADSGSYRAQPKSFDSTGVSGALMAMYDMQLKQAQTDNLKMAVEVAKQQILQSQASTASTEFSTERSRALLPIDIESARAGIEKTYADVRSTLDSNERAAAMQAYNLQQAAENILSTRAGSARTAADTDNIRATLDTIRNSDTLQKLDIALKRLGIQPGDPLWSRVLGRIMNDPEPIKAAGRELLKLPFLPLSGVMKMDSSYGHGVDTPRGKWRLPNPFGN